MLKKYEVPIWGRLRVAHKLATIPALFVLALGGILYYILVNAQDQKLDVFAVNMAARQRMMINRQLAQVLMVSLGVSRPGELPPSPTIEYFQAALRNADYLATRKLASDTVDAILNGGMILDYTGNCYRPAPGTRDPDLREKLLTQKAALTNYNDTLDKFLTVKPSDPEYPAKLRELLDAANRTEATARIANMAYANSLEARIARMIQWCTLIGVVVTILGLAFSWLVTRGIVQPLGDVLGVAQRIARGDLRAPKLPDESNDEVGLLATGFNEMLESLKGLAGHTVTVTENLNSAAAEILASTQQQATGTKEQAATIQQITATMEEVRQSGVQISEKAKQVAAAAEASASSTVAGLNTVQDSNRTMEAIRQQVEDVAENIVALSEKTQAVSEIITTVNDIAERSNLLALNAAIEAAAAGEQGNRFSVVANEIKNLADQAKESTVQVRTILGDIQKRINSSVMLTEEAVKRSETGKQQAETSERTIRRMADMTQESVQVFQQIIGATSQQQIGFEQVTQGMQDIGQAASQTAAGTVQLERAVASLNAQSHQLREAVGRYQL